MITYNADFSLEPSRRIELVLDPSLPKLFRGTGFTEVTIVWSTILHIGWTARVEFLDKYLLFVLEHFMHPPPPIMHQAPPILRQAPPLSMHRVLPPISLMSRDVQPHHSYYAARHFLARSDSPRAAEADDDLERTQPGERW